MSGTVKCEYCGRERSYACNGTRDMEDFAEDGDNECFYQLAKSGVVHGCGGEKGLRYVVLNREARAERRQGNHSEIPNRSDGGGKEPNPLSLMSKEALAVYALERFGVDLDRRRTLKALRGQVRQLEPEDQAGE